VDLFRRREPGAVRPRLGKDGQFHGGFDSQVGGDALDDQTQVPSRWVAVVIEHSMQGFFPQSGLPGQFLKANGGVDEVAEPGKRPGTVAFQKHFHRASVK